MTVLVGGSDIDTGNALADVWEWIRPPGHGRSVFTGSEPNLPPARMYASLVTDSAQDLLDLVGGVTSLGTDLPAGEIWELNPATAAFTNRTPLPPKDWPSARTDPAMAFCPATGKTYVFGGQDEQCRVARRPVGVGRHRLVAGCKRHTTRRPHECGDGLRPIPQVPHSLTAACADWRLVLLGADFRLILGDTWEWRPAPASGAQLFPKLESRASRLTRHGHRFGARQGAALRRRKTYSYDSTYPTPGSPQRLRRNLPGATSLGVGWREHHLDQPHTPRRSRRAGRAQLPSPELRRWPPEDGPHRGRN